MYLRFFLFTIVFFQSALSKASWSNVFNKAMTGVHWAWITSPALGWAINDVAGPYVMKQLPDTTSEISSFVKDELKKHNCSETMINDLSIKVGEKFEAGYILDGKHIISIPHNFNDMNAWSAHQKMEISGIMRHEMAHLEHKDSLRTAALTLASPFLSHYIVKGITYPATFVLRPYVPLAVQSMAKLPAAILKVGVMIPIILSFDKYIEYSADKVAAQNIKDPKILKLFAKEMLTNYENYERANLLDPQERGTWRRFMHDESHYDFSHPNGLIRSKIFEDAAKKLEKSVTA